MTTAGSADGVHRAQDLGSRALAEIVGRTRAAVMVLDGDRRIVYANTAACQLLGEPLTGLRGRDLIDHLSVDEAARLPPQLDLRSDKDGATFTCVVRDAGDTEREVVGSTYLVRTGVSPLVAVVLWDQSEQQAAARRGAALAQMATQLGATSVDDMLSRVAQHAVEGTSGVGCELVVVGDNDEVTDSGAFSVPRGSDTVGLQAGLTGPPADADQSAAQWVSVITGDVIRIGDVADKPVVLPDARTMWQSHPITRDHAVRTAGLPYRAAIGVPLSWRNHVIGLCLLYLPPKVGVVTEIELAFVTALADHAALAVVNARLTARAGETAALRERARLARDLHDSVSQSLFAMTLHARAAQLAMAGAASADPLVRSLDEVAQLTRHALVEMRAMIFELRPEALSEDGLAAALRQQASELSVRDGFVVSFDGLEERIAVDSEVEEQLYRIGVEALNNIVKHARATTVNVRIEQFAHTVRLTITDDGAGFDTQTAHPGHLGLSTMADRARLVGAELVVKSSPGKGTTVKVVSQSDLSDALLAD